MSAYKLAQKVGCTQPGLTQWLTGVRGLGTELAEKLARYYGLTLK
jgi:plasmid maintenance system antidote protein VapI